MQNRKPLLKKIFLSILVILLLLGITFNEIILYGLSQGYGQAKIIFGAKPIDYFLSNPTYPDSLKKKILLVQEVRKFAFDSLGLNFSENYTTMYDQEGKPVLWVVTACEPFALKAKQWTFPLVGKVSYKGFFKYEKAKQEEAMLKKEGYDTSIDEVGGWSTLGWFKDPLLSSMLERSEGSLVNLIIHELTHGTLFVKDNVDFNENLASFVGNTGTAKFLKYKYGPVSDELLKYERNKIYSKEYTQLVLSFSRELDSTYNAFTINSTQESKVALKNKMFEKFRNKLMNFFESSGYKVTRKKAGLENINNTYFMDVKRYRENLEFFEKEFNLRFKANFHKYMEYLKNKYPSV